MLARVNADGSLDSGFSPNVTPDIVECIVLQPDGKILIGGRFTEVQPTGLASPAKRKFLARFNHAP